MRSVGEVIREKLVSLARRIELFAYRTNPSSPFKLSESEVQELILEHEKKKDKFRESSRLLNQNNNEGFSWPSDGTMERIDFLGQQLCLTQKKTTVDWCHGFLLDSIIRTNVDQSSQGVILDFGTARGFSAIVMAEALMRNNSRVTVFTFDILPHEVPMFWNSPSDYGGPKSRREIWDELGVDTEVICVEGPITSSLPRLKNWNVLVAFIDSQHSLEQVNFEITHVITNQEIGGILVFDDYGSNGMDAVKKAAEYLLPSSGYELQFEIFTGYKNLAVWRKVTDERQK